MPLTSHTDKFTAQQREYVNSSPSNYSVLTPDIDEEDSNTYYTECCHPYLDYQPHHAGDDAPGISDTHFYDVDSQLDDQERCHHYDVDSQLSASANHTYEIIPE